MKEEDTLLKKSLFRKFSILILTKIENLQNLKTMLTIFCSQIPTVPAQSLVRELSSEGGLTPLHLAAYSGSENVVRGLLNSPAVQVSS